MKLEAEQKKLRAYPVQLIESDAAVLVRRGAVQLKVSGNDALSVVERVFELAGREAGATEEEIAGEFAAPDRGNVRTLVNQLLERRLLVPSDEQTLASLPEGPLDVFYWHFGETGKSVADRANQQRISILGVNAISKQLLTTLRASGFERLEVVDYPLLRNLRFTDPAGKLVKSAWGELPEPIRFEAWADAGEELEVLVATSDFGGLQAMRRWNEFALEMGCHFLPIVLQDMIGYVGPLVIPGETACYECLRARENANLTEVETTRAAEEHAFEGQSVISALPAMASILGDFAAIELTKFYGRGLPNPSAGTLLEINLLRPTVSVRKVLKVPRCRVCSPLLSRGSVSPEKNVFLPGNASGE